MVKKHTQFLILFNLFFLIYFHLKADDNFFNAKYLKVGALGSLNFINNSTDIPVFPGSKLCGNFTNGSATGFSFGLNVLYPFYDEVIFLEAGVLYERRPADLSRSISEYQVFNPDNNTYQDLVIKYDYSAKLDYLILDFGIRYKPLIQIPAYIRLGFDAGNPLIGTNYTKTEAIESPNKYLFPDETSKHVIQSGTINNSGTSIGANLGLIYEFQLENGIYLSPGISYRFALNSSNSEYNWKSNILKFAISAMWKINLEHDKITIDTIKDYEEKPIEIQNKQEIDYDIIRNFEIDTLNLIETTVTQTYPLLPYIFFDENSSAIRDVYVKNTNTDFYEKDLPKETMGIYYNILNIIGSRLRNNNSIIEIRGTSDGKEAETKDERIKIARLRAETIADYFVKDLKINKSRITVTASDLPELETSTAYSEGYEENRRVELISKDIDLFKPVIHKQFSEFIINDNSLNIKLIVDSSVSNRIFKFILHNDSNVIYSENLIPSIDNNYSIKLNTDLKSKLLAYKNDIKASIQLIDLNNKKANTKTIDLVWSKKINNFELGRLNLIVFDFDKYELNKINKEMISDFINNTIQNNSEVTIAGSTDRLGEKLYNQKLSEDRAVNTADFIKKLKSKSNIKSIKGIGDNNLIYNNDLPEGRFYCRTVLIEVKTPINK